MIEIDGSFGEGGGQILRSSLSLAAVMKIPLQIHNIRAKRSQPGLRSQHLAAVKAIAKITQAELHGAEVGSQNVTLIPKHTKGGQYQFEIPTAGALSLVLQTVFLPLSFTESHSALVLTGGTHVPWSPIFHYLSELWLPVMAELGFRMDLVLEKAGFYPPGGGRAAVKVLPTHQLNPFYCKERGDLLRIRGLSGVANLSEEIAKRQKHQALKRLYAVCHDSKIKTLQMPAASKGTFILLKTEFEHCAHACFTALGAPGKPAEQVADEAVDQTLAFLQTQACVDPHLADQLLLPLSIIEGESQFTTSQITQHLLTNAYVLQLFLPVKIKITGELGQPGMVQVEGRAVPLPD